MALFRSASHRLAVVAAAAALFGAPAAVAGGPWHAAAGGGQGGWRAPSTLRPYSPFPHAPAGNGFGVRNPYPGVRNFSYSRTAVLPGGRSVSYDRTFSRTGYGDYTYDRSVTGPGGRTASRNATQTYNPANGSYTRTVTTTGFNGKTNTSTTDFTRSSRGNYAYSYTDVGPDGRSYTRTIDQTFNPANHDLTRTGSTTLRDGQTANYTTTVNNAGNGIYDYSASWNGLKGGSGSVSGSGSR